MVNNKTISKLSIREKILKHLIENKQPESIMRISKHLNADYKNTFNAINNFSPGIIIKQKIGNTNLIKIKPIPNTEILSIEHKRTQIFLQENKKLALIKEDIESLGYPFIIALIFGSQVKKTQTRKSDIDICIISDNKQKTEKLISKLNLLPLNIEIHDFNSQEFESMLETRKENIAKAIIKNNIILYGIENYYSLISKWMTQD